MRYFTLFLAMILILGCIFTACGQGDTVNETTGTDNETEVTKEDTEVDVTEIDPAADAEYETEKDGEDGSFYDSLTKENNKWKSKDKETSLKYTADGMKITTTSYDTDGCVGRTLGVYDNFEIEFRMKIDNFGKRIGFRCDLKDSRIMMYIYKECVTLFGVKQNIDEIFLPIETDWHIYKFIVDGDTVHFYFDGQYVVSYNPQRTSSMSGVTFFGAAITTSAEEFTVDYVKCTPAGKSPVSILDIADGSVYTDTKTLSLTAKVDSSVRTEGGKVIYKANGVSLGGSDNQNIAYAFDWEKIPDGTYFVTAEYGDYVSPAVKVTFGNKNTSGDSVKAKGKTSAEDQILRSYELEYSVRSTAEANMTASDGIFTLSLTHKDGKVLCKTADGTKEITAGSGKMNVLVDGGYCNLYYKRELVGSFIMPLEYASEGYKVSGDKSALSDISVKPYNEEYYSFDVNKSIFKNLDDFGMCYAVEFLCDSADKGEFALYDGNYRAEISFENGVISALDSPRHYPVHRELGQMPEGKHLWRLAVEGGIARLYCDNIWFDSVELNQSVSDRVFRASGNFSAVIRGEEERYYCRVENGSDKWDEYISEGLSFSKLGGNCERDSQAMLLNAYAHNSVLEATVDLGNKNSGEFLLVSRYMNSFSGVSAGYDFSAGKYVISNSGKEITSKYDEAPKGKITFRLVTENNKAELYINGTNVISGALALDYKYNSCGYITDGGVKLISVDYEGDGPIQKKVERQLMEFNYPEIITLNDGRLLMSDEQAGWISEDNGHIWRGAVKSDNIDTTGLGKNIVRLQNGNILSIKRTSTNKANVYLDYACISSDEGKTWTEYQVQGKASYRITMNCKITQVSSGRIFFLSGETGHGVEHSAAAGLYYSDNNGMTWKLSKTELSYKTLKLNLQEPSLVELENGKLRIYYRSGSGFLYYIESQDNGDTWDVDPQPSELGTVCSAFNTERDYKTGDIYIAWENSLAYDNGTTQNPRNRVSLAVSHDNGASWEFIGDADCSHFTTGHYNIGINLTDDAVYVTFNKAWQVNSNGKTETISQVVRFERDGIVTLARMPKLHVTADRDARVAGYYRDTLGTSIISTEQVTVYGNEVIDTEIKYNGKKTYVSLSELCDIVGAKYSLEGNVFTMTHGKEKWTFTADSDTVEVKNADPAKLLTAAKKTGGTMMITLEDISLLFGLRLAETDNYTAVYYSEYECNPDFAEFEIHSIA